MAKSNKPVAPATDYDVALLSSGAKVGTASTSMRRLALDAINPLEGFNVRVTNSAAYHERVEELAKSIVANGFYESKPLVGITMKDEDGKDQFFLTDGYHRLAAIHRAIELGYQGETYPVIVEAKGTSSEDLHVKLYTANKGNELAPIELAALVARMVKNGLPESQVAERLDISTRYVDGLLLLNGAPAKLREMVMKGEVTGTLAIDQLHKSGVKALDILKAGLERAKAKGKDKVTAKHIDKPEKKSKAKKEDETTSVATPLDKGDTEAGSVLVIDTAYATAILNAMAHVRSADLEFSPLLMDQITNLLLQSSGPGTAKIAIQLSIDTNRYEETGMVALGHVKLADPETPSEIAADDAPAGEEEGLLAGKKKRKSASGL